jgi:phage I-like protein
MDEAVTAITTLQTKLGESELALSTARNTQATPDAAQYVPMAQYESVQARAAQAETALNAHTTAARDAAISTALDAAIAAGKIAPATRDFYAASCTQEGGLDRFTAFIEAAPKILADSGMDQRTPPAGQGLTPEQKAMCVSLGIAEADYATSLAQTTHA